MCYVQWLGAILRKADLERRATVRDVYCTYCRLPYGPFFAQFLSTSVVYIPAVVARLLLQNKEKSTGR